MLLSVQDLRWYLIQCKPHQDARALENLERQGYSCFRPTRTVERLRSGRKQTGVEPLFPGYLFVRLDRVQDNWYPIRSTRGVSRIVAFSGDPMPVADRVIEGIQSRLAGRPKIEPVFAPGERVQVAVGKSHLDAIFVAQDGEERVTLLLNLLQQTQELTVPLQRVRKTG